MPGKTEIKRVARIMQDDKCWISGILLPEDNTAVDTHRKLPRSKGGTYTPENTTVVIPKKHSELHGNKRVRTPEEEELKMYLERRRYYMKIRIGITNKIDAITKREMDREHPDTIQYMDNLSKELIKQEIDCEKKITKLTKKLYPTMINAMKDVKGAGIVLLAYLMVYVDITKAMHASSLWKYIGVHAASHERYEKGKTSGGNSHLRAMVFGVAAGCFLRNKDNLYKEVYYRTKAKLEISQNMTVSYDPQGNKLRCMWKDTMPKHRHGAAVRKMMKHFLADFWLVYRTLEGLPTRNLWVEQYGGHTTITMPRERGWKY